MTLTQKRYTREIHRLYRQGKPVRVREHESGFPTVTVDVRTSIFSPISSAWGQW